MNAIAPFAKEENFVTNVNTTIDVLLKYRVASIEATAVKGKLKLEQQEHGVMEQEFADRLRKADELAASVAERIQHADLVMPKPCGRKRMRRLSTLTLACDDDEAFSSEADANQAAAAAMSNLSAEQASQSLAFGEEDDEEALPSDEEVEDQAAAAVSRWAPLGRLNAEEAAASAAAGPPFEEGEDSGEEH